MANQRKKTKKKLQIWLEDEDRKKLAGLAEDYGFETVTAFVQAVASGEVVISQPPKSSKSDEGGKR